MKKLLLGFSAALLCAAFVATEADAARLGGARSSGVQRNVTSAPPSAAPAKPAQQQTAPAAQPQPASGVAQPASGFARWAPLLGGLALGGALGWLMGANGMGGMLVGMMLLALLVFAGIFIVRMLMSKRSEAPPALAGQANIPDGFDVAGFLKGAKLNYMRLQIANDQGNLEELREFTSD